MSYLWSFSVKTRRTAFVDSSVTPGKGNTLLGDAVDAGKFLANDGTGCGADMAEGVRVERL
jgi:hypothetical protein